MPTKKELEDRLKLIEKETANLVLEYKLMEKEFDRLGSFVGMLGFTLQEVYRCYPFVLKEVCTDKQLVKLFGVQLELTEFINKIKKQKREEDEKESGF